MSNTQSVKAVAKYIRMSPHKIRRVLDQIRGRSYQEALMILEFLPYDAGGPIWQVVHSAAANAKHNYGLDKKKLIIDEIFADEGPKLKRIRPRAQGRAYKILKPTCHITVIMKANNKKKQGYKIIKTNFNFKLKGLILWGKKHIL
jgi:large subunit ribosomal protein L22